MKFLQPLVLSSTLLLLVACSSQNSDTAKLIGSWNYELEVSDGVAMTMTFAFDTKDSMNVIMFGQELGKLSYSLEDGFLKTVTQEGERDSMAYSFSGDTLVLIMDPSTEGRTLWLRGEAPAPMIAPELMQQPTTLEVAVPRDDTIKAMVSDTISAE